MTIVTTTTSDYHSITPGSTREDAQRRSSGITNNNDNNNAPPPPTSQVFGPRISSIESNNNNNNNDNLSHVSGLTEYSTNDGSVVSKIGSVLAQARLILQGHNPSQTVWEEDSHDVRVENESPYRTEGDSSSISLNRRNYNKNNNINNIDEDDDYHSSVRSKQTIDFLKDPKSEMTNARRIALHLMKHKWYNPHVAASADPDKEGEEKTADDDNNNYNENNSSNTDEKLDGVMHLKKDENGIIRSSAAGSDHNQMKSSVVAEAYPFSHSRREIPSLEKAWVYFEHVALPRHIVEPNNNKKKRNVFVRVFRRIFCKGSQQLQRAEPGEDHMPTKLYRPTFTPHSQLGDWGLGVGLYFSTLRAVFILTFLAGCLNLINILYYSSDEYSGGQPNLHSNLMRGSQICTEQVYVPCVDCFYQDNIIWNGTRLGTGGGAGNGKNNTLQFARHNACVGVTIEQGMVNWATIILITVGIFCLNIYMRHMEVTFDEDEQTAQDYSIIVTNPPPDATDPDEWRNYFRDNFNGAQVTVCTVAVENDLLVRSLVERREILRKMEMMVDPGTSMDQITLAALAAKEERGRRIIGRLMARISPGLPELFGRLAVLTAKVQGLAQQEYPATNVFLTFEREADQRHVLEQLTTGAIPAQRNYSKNIKSHHLFRGKHVLHVAEPDEPNTIRWQDLNENWKDRVRQQGFTTIACVIAIVLVAFVVFVCNNASVVFAAYAISIFNAIFPMFAKYLTSLEAHWSDGGKQRSLYFKIALFRWVNTAVVITIITPLKDTITPGGLIKQIYALFFAEITTTNALQILDIGGHIQRHILAPRAKTQDAMNLAMQGQPYELAERYTNMTKILFLALWYCSIYPGALFLCSLSLFLMYYVDRFSLMRTWKRAPHLGPETSRFSREYFFPVAILAMTVVSSYYWSGFPFDNVCATNHKVPVSYLGSWQLNDKLNSTVNITSSDVLYQHCLQDFFRYHRNETHFPFFPKYQRKGQEWMSEDQEFITNLFGWSTVAVIGILFLLFCLGVAKAIYSMFYDSYKPRGKDQEINFSEVKSISSYIPQVESQVYSYPLLACNVDGLDEELFDWTDPDKPYSYYDLTKDAEVLLRGLNVRSKMVFSHIKHWPVKKSRSSTKP